MYFFGKISKRKPSRLSREKLLAKDCSFFCIFCLVIKTSLLPRRALTMISWLLRHFLGMSLHPFILTSFYSQNMRVTIQQKWITIVLVMMISGTTIMLIMIILQQMSITTKIISVFLLNKSSASLRHKWLGWLF